MRRSTTKKTNSLPISYPSNSHYIIIIIAPNTTATITVMPLVRDITPVPVKGVAPVYCTFAASVVLALPEETAKAVIVGDSDATVATAEEAGSDATAVVEIARVVLATSEVVPMAAGVSLVAGRAALLLETDGAT